MPDTQQPNDAAIEAAIAAYNNLTPDSINAFRDLNHIEALVVIKVLKQTNPPKKRRSDAGVKRNKPGPQALTA